VGITWLYVSKVKAILEWSSISLTILGLRPPNSIKVVKYALNHGIGARITLPGYRGAAFTLRRHGQLIPSQPLTKSAFSGMDIFMCLRQLGRTTWTMKPMLGYK